MTTYFPPWLIWFVIGIAVSLSELVLPGFVIIFFGIGCLGAAAFAVVLPQVRVPFEFAVELKPS